MMKCLINTCTELGADGSRLCSRHAKMVADAGLKVVLLPSTGHPSAQTVKVVHAVVEAAEAAEGKGQAAEVQCSPEEPLEVAMADAEGWRQRALEAEAQRDKAFTKSDALHDKLIIAAQDHDAIVERLDALGAPLAATLPERLDGLFEDGKRKGYHAASMDMLDATAKHASKAGEDEKTEVEHLRRTVAELRAEHEEDQQELEGLARTCAELRAEHEADQEERALRKEDRAQHLAEIERLQAVEETLRDTLAKLKTERVQAQRHLLQFHASVCNALNVGPPSASHLPDDYPIDDLVAVVRTRAVEHVVERARRTALAEELVAANAALECLQVRCDDLAAETANARFDLDQERARHRPGRVRRLFRALLQPTFRR